MKSPSLQFYKKLSIIILLLLALVSVYFTVSGQSFATDGSTPQDVALSTTIATSNDSFAIPPDTMGAVGPTQFLLTLNSRVETFDKVHAIPDNALNTTLAAFFQSAQEPSRTFITDPQVRYDGSSGHWFVSALGDCDRLLIAVSGGPIITATDWRFHYFFPQNGTFSCASHTQYFVDQPWLGVDTRAVYLSGTDIIHDFPTPVPGGYFDAFVIDKNNLINNTNLVQNVYRFPSIGRSQQAGINYPRGVTNYDPNATNGWFIGNDGDQRNRLVLRKVSYDANNVPSLSADIFVTVDAFYAPDANVPQPTPQPTSTRGTLGIGAELFKQLTSSTLRNGEIWTSHTIAVNNLGQAVPTCESGFTDPSCRDALHWYRINVTGATPQVTASYTIFDPNNYYVFGSVMVSGQGNALFGMTISGQSTFPSAGAAYLLAGTTVPSGLVATQAGTAPYYPSSGVDSGNPLRWGDYSFTSLDPCDDMTMWTLQEYAFSSTAWGLWAAKVRASPPQISNVTSAVGRTHKATVIITGSDFYNPNITTYCHIPIQISTGPSVVARLVSYSPTTLTVEVNTCMATALETMTVVNPDQQVSQRDFSVTNIQQTHCPADYPGVYRPSQGVFYMKTGFTGTPADLTVQFGAPKWYPVTGDWNGDGFDTPGVINPANSVVYLTNTTNGLGTANYTFVFGNPGDKPLAGKWTATATHDGIGVFRPSNGLIYLRNELSTGFADFTMVLGNPSDIGITGDWNSDNIDSPGVYRPSNGIFYLSNKVTNGIIFGDISFPYGLPGDLPVAADWTGGGFSSIGVYRPSDNIFRLKYTLAAGNPDQFFAFGQSGDLPLMGHWLGSAVSPPPPPAQSGIIVPSTPLPVTPIVQPTNKPTLDAASFDG